jgi:hypothetical protein
MKPEQQGFQIVDACTDHISMLDLARLISRREGLPEPEHEIDFSLPVDYYGGDRLRFLRKLEARGLEALSLDSQIEDTKRGLSSIGTNFSHTL